MATAAEIATANSVFFENLTGGREKVAADAINDFTRTKMREDGFLRRILPAIPIGNDELDKQIHTDSPYKIIEKEPGSPAAASVPFKQMPVSLYIYGEKYAVTFSRIMTRRFQKDVEQLRTYTMDIRQVLSDNTIKDILAEEDGKWILACNTVMIGPDVPVPINGNIPQWETIEGGITRETLQDARKIMPRGPSRLEAHTALVNSITIKEFEKFGRDEMGGDFSQDILKNGWAETEFANMRWIITIKRDIVPDDSMFMFADPKFIGKHFELEATTMYIRREAFMIEWFTYQTSGASIGHTGGITRADFA